MTRDDAAEGGGPGPIAEGEVQAWIDGRLPPGRRSAVEALLAANPEEATRIRAMAVQRDMLRNALRQVLTEPIPPRLRVASLLAARRRGRRRTLALSAAFASSLAAGLALGWFGRAVLASFDGSPSALSSGPFAAGAGPSAGGRMVTEAVAAHNVFTADARRPVEIAAAQEAQLVQWLSNRLGRRLSAPDLTPLGLRLIGGRLLPGPDGQPAAQLMYETEGGERLTLYLRADASDREAAFRFTLDPRTGIAAFWWVDHGFGYAVLAKTGREELLRVAEAVHRQLVA